MWLFPRKRDQPEYWRRCSQNLSYKASESHHLKGVDCSDAVVYPPAPPSSPLGRRYSVSQFLRRLAADRSQLNPYLRISFSWRELLPPRSHSLPIGIGWGHCCDCVWHGLTSPSQFYWQYFFSPAGNDSGKHSPVNFLHANLHLRVYFLGHTIATKAFHSFTALLRHYHELS